MGAPHVNDILPIESYTISNIGTQFYDNLQTLWLFAVSMSKALFLLFCNWFPNVIEELKFFFLSILLEWSLFPCSVEFCMLVMFILGIDDNHNAANNYIFIFRI